MGTYSAGSNTDKNSEKPRANWVVVGVTLTITLAVAIWAMVEKDSFDSSIGTITS